MDWTPPGFFVLGKNTGVGCRVLVQAVFALHLHWQVDSFPSLEDHTVEHIVQTGPGLKKILKDCYA